MVSPAMRQTWLSSAILLNMLGMGMQLGFTSCLLPGLEASDSTIRISLETSSWLVASLGIGNMFGYALTSSIMDRLGRRITFGIDLVPAIAGLLLTFYATNATFLICGRVLTGLTAGASFTMGSVVIGECCSPQYRSMFLNMKTATLYVGSSIVHALGHYYHWRMVALLTLSPFVISLLITCTWPESPYWLAQRGRFKESEEVFYRLRGTTEDSVREIEELISAQRIARKTFKKTFSGFFLDFFKKFTKRNFLQPMMIFVVAVFLLETSGRHIFAAYASQIIDRFTDNRSYTFYFNVAFDVMVTVSAFFSAYLIKKIKLRRLLFVTGSVTFITLGLACFFMYLAAKNVIPKGYSAIPISLFGLYLIFVNLGCAPVPLTLMGEIFPLEHRAVATSIAGYLISLGMTITLKMMPVMLHTLEIYGAFAVLALCMALSLVALYFILPETKNRTLQEIEGFFNNGRFREGTSKENVNLRTVYREV